MPEPHDFEQIARRILRVHGRSNIGADEIADVAEHLRLVWNARGVVDAHAVEEKLSTLTGWVTSEPYRHHLRDAITAQDR